jgi:lipid-A-disaccharide synthase
LRLLISCGEPSGDLYAAELVRHLREHDQELSIFGLGGDRMAAQGVMLLAHVRELAVVGLLEVVRHLPRLRRIFGAVLDDVDRDPPAAAVLVDYPDFNLRLARELKRRSVPVVYYVSPQIWAWRGGRIRQIRENVARMLVIFPFEEELYRSAGVSVEFVGHPLVDLVKPGDARALLESLGMDPQRPVVALLPGSRPQEVAHNLPELTRAVSLLSSRRPDLQYLLAAAPALESHLLEQAMAKTPVRVVAGNTHGVISASTVALVASGTATVETALLGTPMVVVYRLSSLTYALGRPFVRVPHYAMVNLIAGRRIVPELIQSDFVGERVSAEVEQLLSPSETARMRTDLAEVRARLGSGGASARAAASIFKVARKILT